MLLFKLFYHFQAEIWKLIYRILYWNNLSLGKGFTFRMGFNLASLDGGRILINDNVFFNNYCSIMAMDYISIGEGTIFGENVKIYDHNHCYKDTNTPIKNQGYKSAPIVIGKHCWIASNVVILKGVTIGDNCVIGAGCIVYKDVPANTILMCKQELIMNPV